jgi:hypothetical protein
MVTDTNDDIKTKKKNWHHRCKLLDTVQLFRTKSNTIISVGIQCLFVVGYAKANHSFCYTIWRYYLCYDTLNYKKKKYNLVESVESDHYDIKVCRKKKWK